MFHLTSTLLYASILVSVRLTFFFFFSSRRRHTRSLCDWSSDVCSSDLLSQHTRDGDDIEVPGIVPKLSLTPGTVRTSAPHVGDDTDAVLAEAGLTAQQIALLRSKGVIQ